VEPVTGVVAGVGAVRILRRLLKIAVVVAAVLVAYLGVTAGQVWMTSTRSEPVPADAIVVMGAAQYNGVPSPVLRARLDQAYRLWSRHLAPVVVLTGFKQPGDQYTEAEAGARYLGALNPPVPADAIIAVGGSDSWDNLAQAAAALHARGLNRVLIVTDGFHEARSLAIATDVGLQAHPVPATGSPITGWSAVPYFAKETFGVAVGRIFGFNHLETFHRALR